jgi:hypothetical protein
MNIKYQKQSKRLNKLIKENILVQNNNAKQTRKTQVFFLTVRNFSNVTFEQNEIKLLEKGLKYNLSYRPKNRVLRLGLEAKTAINLVNPEQQNQLRHAISEKLKR